MAKKIALFNYKGGVSKTTTTFHLGWMLAEKGKRVILVDADPQCNLTGIILGYRKNAELEDFYQNENKRNLRDGLAPAFESMPKMIEAVDCFEVDGRPGLFLLPGHIRLAEYDVTLGIAQELSGTIQTLKNLPGSISFLLDKTAEKFQADYILIDMSPSLNSINQNVLMTSDYFLVPASPDYFSVMAVDSLATIFEKWSAWSRKAQSLKVLEESTYPFPRTSPKFLGTVVQKYNIRKGNATKGFQKWIDDINAVTSSKLIGMLGKQGMSLPEDAYKQCGIVDTYCLTTIPDFNTLIAISQEQQTPVFALTADQLGSVGTVLEQHTKKRDEFHKTFADLADKIVCLTS